MKKASKLSLLAGASLMLTASFANAGGMNQDVVRDDRGNVIVNTWNNCVLTKWQGGDSQCGNISRDELTVYFGFDSAALTSAGRSKLNNAIAQIKKAGNVDSVSIVGFADEIGASDYNQRLSNRRANAVRSYLNRNGVNTAGVSLRALGETGSKSACAGSNGNERIACLWQDRRVELELNY